jgi:hypothetical protein
MPQTFLTLQSNKLRELVSVALAKFSLFNESAWNHKPAPEKWSKKEILGHLVDSAANNHLRFVRAQLAEKEFVSFAYEQNFFVSSQQYQNCSSADLVAFWQAYNIHLAHVIQHINPEVLGTLCRIGNYEPVTFEFLVKDYNDHLVHHLNQIFKS